MTLDESTERLENTWKHFPDDPITVSGFPISCPGCGSADDLRFWLYSGESQVRAEHTCVPYAVWRESSTVRSWAEPRVSPEFMREHGVNALAGVADAAERVKRNIRATY